jgi:protein CpxP
MRVSRFAILAGLLLIAAVSFAQMEGPPPEHGQGGGHRGMPSTDDQLKHLDKELSLTADQKAQIKPILEDAHAQSKKLMEDDSIAREDKMPKMREIHEASNTKIRALLTDAQQKKWDAMQKEHHGHMGHGGPEGAPPPPPPPQ